MLNYVKVSTLFCNVISLILRFSVYSGHHTILIPPVELETSPSLWLQAVSQYKGNLYYFQGL